MKMGTIEPRYDDSIQVNCTIVNDGLAFIYGAIKKYGHIPELLPELKEYIIKEAEYIYC